MINNQKVGAIIVAAGRGERMGGADKTFALLAGESVLARVISVFQNCAAVDEIAIVLAEASAAKGQKLVAEQGFTKVSAVCQGGHRRQDSAKNGLDCLADCHWVVIHDGARPLLTEKLITEGLAVASRSGTAIAAVPVTDTIKVADDDGYVLETPPRRNLWAVQTPQVFRSDIINKAHQQQVAEATDDASLVEALGHKVRLYAGSYDNIKITTPADMTLAELIWQKRDS